MSPKEVLQVAGAELDRLSQQMTSRDSTPAQLSVTVESITERLIALGEEISSIPDPELLELMQGLQAKAKRVQRLLEAGTLFHCHSILATAEEPETYSSDGTFGPNQDCRIIFQG
ncbi:MAG: hypothetical protein ACJ74Y_04670 [Bryobacteraceae bacterium]